MPPCHGGGRGFESRPDRKSRMAAGIRKALQVSTLQGFLLLGVWLREPQPTLKGGQVQTRDQVQMLWTKHKFEIIDTRKTFIYLHNLMKSYR